MGNTSVFTFRGYVADIKIKNRVQLQMLLEVCCKCGFVHKDSRIRIGEKPYRVYKPHYHWTPTSCEVVKHGDVTLHPTICVACCDESINWKAFFEQKDKTPEQYRVKWSLNAPLPEGLIQWASDMYAEQAKYFEFE